MSSGRHCQTEFYYIENSVFCAYYTRKTDSAFRRLTIELRALFPRIHKWNAKLLETEKLCIQGGWEYPSKGWFLLRPVRDPLSSVAAEKLTNSLGRVPGKFAQKLQNAIHSEWEKVTLKRDIGAGQSCPIPISTEFKEKNDSLNLSADIKLTSLILN